MEEQTGIEVLKEKTVYGHTVLLEEVPLETFMSYPECDVQRDTEGRAKRAFRSHLKHNSPLHGLVFLAELPDGERFVIDACTRKHLWQTGVKAPIDSVTAFTVKCASEEDARQFYFQLDSSSAVDRASDIAFGLLRAQQVQPKSELVRKSGYLSGLKKAFGGARKDLVERSAPLLEYLDSLNMKSRALPAGALAAFFLTTLRYGETALPFWSDVLEARGISNDDGRTPALALNRRIEILRAENKLTGDRNVTKLMELSLSLFMEWAESPEKLIPDDWSVTLKRDTYIRMMTQENPDIAALFEKPSRPKAPPAGGGQMPRKRGRPRKNSNLTLPADGATPPATSEGTLTLPVRG